MRPRRGTDVICATCTSRRNGCPRGRSARPVSEQQSALPADPRGPGIVHAHQSGRRTNCSRARRAQPGRCAQPALAPGSR
jgi:hypothetical protein